MPKSYRDLFVELDNAISCFLAEVNKKKLTDRVKKWTVKDVLGHITFWHRYYAQQYESLAQNTDPFFFESLAGKNEEARKEMDKKSKKWLVAALSEAQESLRESIVQKRVPRMHYMRSHEYATGDFLKVVISHISRHTVSVRRAKPSI
jgi:hypothetical protein